MAATNSNRYLHTLVTIHLLQPSSLIPLSLLLLRQNIFPANTLPSPTSAAVPPLPSAAQVQQIKRTCAEGLLSLVPAPVSRQLLGKDEDAAIKDVEAELDVWGDAYCNKHLLYAITDLIFVRVLPELGEKGVRDLLVERLGEDKEGAWLID